MSINGGKLELNSKHITVHQTSEEESDNEGRRTASLGDLSKLEFTTCPSGPRSNNGTLERAQSLEMSDSINQVIAGKATPKKRKAPLNDPSDTADFKEPRLSDAAATNLDTLQRGRLKSAYEWGNLEDAIYDGQKENGNVSDTESIENETIRSKLSSSSMDMMTEVLAAADKFDKEIKDIDLNEVINVVTKTEIIDNNDVVKKEIKHEAFVINWDPKENNKVVNTIKVHTADQNNQNIENTKKFIEIESRNGIHDEKPTNGVAYSPEPTSIDDGEHQSHHHHIQNVETITISPVQFQMSNNESVEADTQQMDSDIKFEKHDSDQIKIINYGSNIPDDVKVTRIPFGSLERPKSEVFKKLIAEQTSVDDHQQHSKVPNGISTTKIVPDNDMSDIETTSANASSFTESGPISLTLGGHIESDLTESSQISPVFSSDGQGVNSISISSTESNIRPESRKDVLNVDNIVTITTDGSQPSSIIMIDDEKLNFTLQTINDDASPAIVPPVIAAKPPASAMSVSNNPQLLPQPQPRASKDEVIIIESLSSKKVQQEKQQPLPRSNGDISPPPKNFVTEIRLQNSRKDNKQIGNNDAEQINNVNNNIQQQTQVTNISETNANHDNHTGKSVIVEEEYIPRNSEIKFTTSTYESPQRHFEKRHSHIDQIRSNFERNHSSEIPVPIRKSAPAGTSTPTSPVSTPTSTARTSPSKIPVFHSQKSSENLLKNNGNVNRVSVTVTSIKNQSRNPSGK